MTPRQRELLDFIRRYQAVNGGVSPSFQEMREAIGISSKSGVARMLDALEADGHLTRKGNRARAIELRPSAASLRQVPDIDIISEFRRRFWSCELQVAALRNQSIHADTIIPEGKRNHAG